MQIELFNTDQPDYQIKEKGAYFTPLWAAELLWDKFMKPFDAKLVCEPSCGTGSCLSIIPKEVEAYGCEIQSSLASIARKNSQREVIEGNFLEIEIKNGTTTFFGNPPFNMDFIQKMLQKISRESPSSNCGFILPAYVLQTTNTVIQIANDWSIQPTLIPRNIFPGLSTPLIFALFTKEKEPVLENMFLYFEHNNYNQIPSWLREKLNQSKDLVKSHSGGWKSAIQSAIQFLGSTDLNKIYQLFEDPKLRPIVFS